MNTDEGSRGCWMAFSYIVLSFLFILVGMVVTGWVGNLLWGWFVTPVFSVSSPGIMLLIGLGLVRDLFTAKVTKEDLKKDDTDIEDRILLSVKASFILQLAKLFILGVGYTLHSFM